MQALKAAGYRVSVDSGNLAELRRGARAGADFLLSLTEETLDLAFETDAVPVLIPARHGELDGLVARLRAAARGRPAVPRRPDPRPDPFRLHRVDRPLPRAAPPPARGRDADGRGQPHRADRRRHHRHHHDPDGHGLRAGDPQHPGRAGEPALPAGGERGRAGAADPLRRQGRRQPAAGLRSGPALPARPASVSQQPGRDREQAPRR